MAVVGFAHPPAGLRVPSLAARILLQAQAELQTAKVAAAADGRMNCCIRPMAGKAPGCDLCLRLRGRCDCGPELVSGNGVCGECKAGYENGRGLFPKDAVPKVIAVKSPPKGTPDAALAKYGELMNEAKRTLVKEGRFGCCVGNGGCDECAREENCGCAANLLADQRAVAKDGAKAKKLGICGQCLNGQAAGIGRMGHSMAVADMAVMADDMGEMTGAFSARMAQEGSGTTWLPGSSPMSMTMQSPFRGWDVMTMGMVQFLAVDAGGKRGERQLAANSMLMGMAQREVRGTRVGLRLMGSLDALTNGDRGYPVLLQTGEGLTDRQHPHDALMEAAVTLSRPIGRGAPGFLYLAPIGEPALGTAAFPHRESGLEIPEAPINHHWNDGTHITYGVLTAGLQLADRWKLEASAFNGREPDSRRFQFDPIRINSYSGRLTWNPSSDWSANVSYGFLRSPEASMPTENGHRWVLGVHYNRPGNRNLAATFIAASNLHGDKKLGALLFEVTQGMPSGSLFFRMESVDKDELAGVPAGTHRVGKLTFGGLKELPGKQRLGVGAYVSLSFLPEALKSAYGSSPVSFGVFARLRTR